MILFLQPDKQLVFEYRGESYCLNAGDSLTIHGAIPELAARRDKYGGLICEQPPEPLAPEPPPESPEFSHLDDVAFDALFQKMRDEHEGRFGTEWREESLRRSDLQKRRWNAVQDGGG